MRFEIEKNDRETGVKTMFKLNGLRAKLMAAALLLLGSQGASAVMLDLITGANAGGQTTLSGILTDLGGASITSYDIRLEIDSGLVSSSSQSSLGGTFRSGVSQTMSGSSSFLRIFERTNPFSPGGYGDSTTGLNSFNLFEIVFDAVVAGPSVVTFIDSISVITSKGGPLTFDPTQPPITGVPLPATAFLFGLGLLGMLSMRKRIG